MEWEVCRMDKSEVELSRLTVKGQCTLPRRILEYLGVKPGDHVAFVVTEHGVLVRENTAHRLRRPTPSPTTHL
jgi:bifunctional DNA-binding transcriptional regulator/antitoxin component of YhaV-PrlF toxin-antitoxin module